MANHCTSCGATQPDRYRVIRNFGKYRAVAVEGLTEHQAAQVAEQLNLALRNEAWKIELEA